MTCEVWQEKIALHAGGDLSRDEEAAVEMHLRACSECAELAEALLSDREIWTEQPAEALTADYAGMRRNIRGTLTHRRNMRWTAGIGLAAAALIAALMVKAPHPRKITPAVPVVAESLAPTVAVAPAIAIHRHRNQRSVLHHDPPTEPAELTVLEAVLRSVKDQDLETAPQSAGAVAIRMTTRNPKVTIMLLQAQEDTTYE